MNKAEFNYHLPPHLIAQRPSATRRDCRLLHLQAASGHIEHRNFPDLVDCLRTGDLLVFNDTRVIPARLYGSKETGGSVEILLERLLSDNRVLAQIRASKTPKAGSHIHLHSHATGAVSAASVTVLARRNEFFELKFDGADEPLDVLAEIGHTPLPPYIDRADDVLDVERYQTVYAKKPGAVAAPTAGLHFDEALLTQLEERGVKMAQVTLHVGAGTFQPVRVDDITKHSMHAEYIEVSEAACEMIRSTRSHGGRVIAVGTTSVRCLETATRDGLIEPYSGDTQIFIYPGYRFQCVDAMITNFHLPESTLLMLVSAFAGTEYIQRAYAEAIEQEYQFFSYGDAMFIESQQAKPLGQKTNT